LFGKDANLSITACTLNNIGVQYLELQEYENSLEYCSESLKMHKNIYGESSDNINRA